jgi:hypothetical protein
MPRSRPSIIPLLLLLSLAVRGAPASAAGPKIGTLADKRETVTGKEPEKERRPLAIKDPVNEKMIVDTEKSSAAFIAIGKGQGAVAMGPESELEFRRGVIDFATGAAKELDFWTQLGQFRFVFLPKPETGKSVLGIPPHQVVIYTPHNTTITLYGTDIYLTVSSQGDTWVYVAEGKVAVQSGKSSPVPVQAGQWTRVADGQAPSQPTRVSSPPDVFSWKPPDQWLVGDPPTLNLQDFGRELPK